MYDVIIVGARVAGSATAMLLARAGLRVLVLDRATFPSDTLSTHQIQVPGVARLARWGVLDPLIETTPTNRRIRFDQGDVTVEARIPGQDGVDFTICPRRTLLDATLVEAARAAGAEIRESAVVDELIQADGRVVGVRGREKAGPEFTDRARLVIGADGRHSTVAKAVGAKECQSDDHIGRSWAGRAVPRRTDGRAAARNARSAELLSPTLGRGLGAGG